MKKTGITIGLVLVLAVPVGGASASGGIGHASPGDAVSFSSTGNVPAIRPAGFSLCPSIAETAMVRDSTIDYVRTREFAEAVSAVANGTSIFAPRRVPAEWKGAANLWGESVAVGGKPRIAVVSEGGGPGGRRAVLVSPTGIPMEPIRLDMDRSCDPQLLFRASIEYRARIGREDLPLLYPHVVRQAASGVGKMVMAKMNSAARNAKRVDDIAARIQQAEVAGAGDCQPNALARAKEELAAARGGISELELDTAVTESMLARAEASTGHLQMVRLYVSNRRIGCVPE